MPSIKSPEELLGTDLKDTSPLDSCFPGFYKGKPLRQTSGERAQKVAGDPILPRGAVSPASAGHRLLTGLAFNEPGLPASLLFSTANLMQTSSFMDPTRK